nr:proline-rich protein HaeIII subfamily 1-like isoform X1 [Manis javanica]
MLVLPASTDYFRCPPCFLLTARSPAAEKEASCLSPPVARLYLLLIPFPPAAARPPPRPPSSDVAVTGQSPAPPAGALQQPPPAGSRSPPRQGPCVLFLTQACPCRGSSPQSQWPPTLRGASCASQTGQRGSPGSVSRSHQPAPPTSSACCTCSSCRPAPPTSGARHVSFQLHMAQWSPRGTTLFL